MDEALFLCITNCDVRGVDFSDAIIKEIVERVKNDFNAVPSPTDQMNLQFSSGLLQKSKKRHGLRRILMHDEQVSADTATANEVLLGLWEKKSGYSAENILNADDIRPQFRILPDHTILDRQLSAHKKDKTRMTCLACCNATGSENFPFRIIGQDMQSALEHFRESQGMI